MTSTDILMVTGGALLVLLLLQILVAVDDLWLHYVALMNLGRLDRERATGGPGLSKSAHIVAVYYLVRGYVLDALVNTLHMTWWLKELPKWRGLREWTVTGRINRHVDGPPGARRDFCLSFRQRWLDHIDTRSVDGVHR